jgi:cysteine-rich repeat protein
MGTWGRKGVLSIALARLAIGAIVVVASVMSAGAALDNKGKDFILSFTPNFDQSGVRQVHLTSDVATSVTVEYPVNLPSFSTTVAVNPGSITVVTLPIGVTAFTPDVVANNAIHLFAAEEFIVYMHNLAPFTSDSALGLPVDTMNTEYIVSGYDEAFAGAEFVVTAAFDATTVTVTPKVAVAGHAAGVAFTKLLNRGEAFLTKGTVTGAGISSLAGSIVTSDKPIGMTNGNGCTQVPIGTVACDTLMEVAQPTQSWSNYVLVVNLPRRPSGSIYRVVGSVGGTTVLLDGVTNVGLIGRGEYVDIGPIAGNHSIAGTNPIFVTQYMTGQGSSGATLGDPAMGNVVPTDQYLNAYTFSTAGAGQFASHDLTIIARTGDIGSVTLDGVLVAAAAFSPIPGSPPFSGAVLPIAEGTHTAASTNGFGIMVSGVNDFDSYLYPGGALFQFINPVGDANPPLCPLTCTAGHCDGVAQDNRPTEDTNGNGILDAGEDLNSNGQIDKDTGVFFIELAAGASNLSLAAAPFVPGAGLVNFTVDPTALPASGTVVVTDGAGNTCRAPVDFAGNGLCGNGVLDAGEQCDDGNTANGDGCSAACTIEGCVPQTEICDNGIDDDCDGLIDDLDTEDCELLYVDLGGLSATPNDGRVIVDWNTLAEIDNAGFYLLRRDVLTGMTVRVNQGLIPARGDVNSGAAYQFTDSTAVNGVEFEYSLVDVDRFAKETRHQTVSAVANPINPRIKLASPAHSARLALGSRTTLTWTPVSLFGASLRISPDATFPEESTVSIGIDARQKAVGRVTLSPRQELAVETMASRNGGVTYWQIVERSIGSVSDHSATFRYSYDLTTNAKVQNVKYRGKFEGTSSDR